MRELVTIDKRLDSGTFLVTNMSDISYTIYSDRSLSPGDTVLLINGNVAGLVYAGTVETVVV